MVDCVEDAVCNLYQALHERFSHLLNLMNTVICKIVETIAVDQCEKRTITLVEGFTPLNQNIDGMMASPIGRDPFMPYG